MGNVRVFSLSFLVISLEMTYQKTKERKKNSVLQYALHKVCHLVVKERLNFKIFLYSLFKLQSFFPRYKNSDI